MLPFDGFDASRSFGCPCDPVPDTVAAQASQLPCLVFISLAIYNARGMRQVNHLHRCSRFRALLAPVLGRQSRLVPLIPQPHLLAQNIG